MQSDRQERAGSTSPPSLSATASSDTALDDGGAEGKAIIRWVTGAVAVVGLLIVFIANSSSDAPGRQLTQPTQTRALSSSDVENCMNRTPSEMRSLLGPPVSTSENDGVVEWRWFNKLHDRRANAGVYKHIIMRFGATTNNVFACFSDY
jgi:hypothetical protein